MGTFYKRTIQDVLNFETGEEINADTFFKKPIDEISVYRSELQKAIDGFREPLFKCYYCKQLIRIRGGIGKPTKRKVDTFHFAHLKDSDDCFVKTDSKLTKEEINRIKYQGARESILHVNLKNKIAECLSFNQNSKGEVSSIQVEKVINNRDEKEWKKPDINAIFQDKRMAIEFQLSTTWLSVITGRQKFYEDQNIYILWIFHQFDPNDDSRKLTYNDVIYTNNQNAYVFDDETYAKSISERDLVLRCWYKVYSIAGNHIKENWEYNYVKLSDLIFNDTSYKLFYHDASAQKSTIIKAHNLHLKNLHVAEEQRLFELQEKEKQKKEFQKCIIDKKANVSIKRKHLEEKSIEQKVFSRMTFEMNNLLQNLDLNLKKIIDQLQKNHFYLSFLDDREFLENLKNDYSQSLIETESMIFDKQKEQKEIQIKLKNIQSLDTLLIGNILFRKLKMPLYWNFVKDNQNSVRIIKSSDVTHLFAQDYLYEITNDHLLNSLKIRTDIVVLMDFSDKIRDYQQSFIINKKVIEKCSSEVNQIKNEVRIKFLKFIDSQLKDLQSKSEKVKIEINACSDEIVKSETDIESLEFQIETLD